MRPDQFVYWLQGGFELNKKLKTLDKEQVQTIKDHLGYVFTSGQTITQEVGLEFVSPTSEDSPEPSDIPPPIPKDLPLVPSFLQETLTRMTLEDPGHPRAQLC